MDKPSSDTSDQSNELDYRALFGTTPSSLLVLDRSFAIAEANDAYCRATMTKRSEIVGRPLFDVYFDNPDDPAADGVRNLRTSLGRVLKFRRSDAMAVQKHDILERNRGLRRLEFDLLAHIA